MGFLDAILGRSRPKAPNLDSLFAVPSAALTLQAALDLRPTGSGSVCFRAASGAAFAQVQQEILGLIEADAQAPGVTVTQDGYGFTWLNVEAADEDLATLCTHLHAVNSTLEAQGFGHGLLCTMIPFESGEGRRVGLVYLYKQGTFYPFAPFPGEQRRDNLLEMSLRTTLTGDLPMEKDLQRWLALWNAPGL